MAEHALNASAKAATPAQKLVSAVSQKNLTAVIKLLEEGADPNGKDTRDALGDTLLLHALREGTFEIAKALIEHHADAEVAFGIYSGTVQGYTPLLWAINNRKEDIVKHLLDHGASPDTQGGRSLTPLMLAARNPRNGDIVRQLLAAGATINTRGIRGETALMQTLSGSGPTDILEQLLDAGADPDIKDDSGKTALMRAAASVDAVVPQAVDILIRKGAALDAQDNAGATALVVACGFNGNAAAGLLLINAGADLHGRGYEGKPLLMLAAHYEKTRLVERLLELHVPLEETDNNGATVRDIVEAKVAAARQKGDDKELAGALGLFHMVGAAPEAYRRYEETMRQTQQQHARQQETATRIKTLRRARVTQRPGRAP